MFCCMQTCAYCCRLKIDEHLGNIRDYHVYPGPCISDASCFPSSPGMQNKLVMVNMLTPEITSHQNPAFHNTDALLGRVTVVGELWGRRRVVPGS